MPDLRAPIPDEILTELLKVLVRSSARTRSDVQDALTDGFTSFSWATVGSILDELLSDMTEFLGGGLLASALAGACWVGERLPAGNTEPTGSDSPGTPRSALIERLRVALESTPAEYRPMFIESLPFAQARALEGVWTGEKPTASDSDMEAFSFVELSPTQLPIVEHAVAELRSRRLVRYEDLQAMGTTARLQALSAAGVVRRDSLGTLQKLLVKQIEMGPDLPKFRKEVSEVMGDDVFLSPRHLETTFRDAVQSAWSGGMDRLLSNPIVGDAFPYEETLPIRDDRLTTLCSVVSRSGIDGTAIFRRDDPTWQRLLPPRHFNCRCGRNVLLLSDAADRGIREAQEWQRTGKPPEKPAWVPMPEIAMKEGL